MLECQDGETADANDDAAPLVSGYPLAEGDTGVVGETWLLPPEEAPLAE
jgi:hypothetical protein